MNNVLVTAAIAGILGAATFGAPALAADDAKAVKGKCIGANACKGKSACGTAANACHGQNACKGKGYLNTTKAECEKLMKKDPKVKFEAA